MKFIHTADWHVGKPYAWVTDADRRAALRQARIDVVRRVGEVSEAHGVDFVLVAGDLLDGHDVSKGQLADLLSALGGMSAPVYAIPGNHDPAEGGLYDREVNPEIADWMAQRAPNFKLCREPEPIFLEEGGASVELIPCPCRGKFDTDATRPLRELPRGARECIRIGLAHGSLEGFMELDEDAADYGTSQRVQVQASEDGRLDYLALGDWHGMQQINERCYYAGTPEPDRFPKRSETYRAGCVLLVEIAEPCSAPVVTPIDTRRYNWCRLDDVRVSSTESLTELIGRLKAMDRDTSLVRLAVAGDLGFSDYALWQRAVGRFRHEFRHLRLRGEVAPVPDEADLEAITSQGGVVTEVARKLIAEAKLPEQCEVARRALWILAAELDLQNRGAEA